MTWRGDPTWLADVLRAEGLKVIEEPGWKQRGHGDFLDIRGIIWHHTAGGGSGDWRIVRDGRPDLPGPLAQLVLERDGTYRVIAAGVCWHAGRGSWPGWPTNNANYHTIGIEAVNDGRGQPWPAVQLDAYRRGTAAIARKAGFGASMAAGHREYSSEGKIDPTGINMDAARADVGRLIKGAPKPAPLPNLINEAAEASKAWIGKRLTVGENKLFGADGKLIGAWAEFAAGHVYWRNGAKRAIAVPHDGGLFDAWAARGWERGELGFPFYPHAVVEGGRVQYFEGGTLLVQAGGDPKGHVVHGRIGEHYAAMKSEQGPLGWPLSDEEKVPGTDNITQRFEHGRLTWSPSGIVVQLEAVA
ncbi:endolysin [Gordonia phage GMA4]|uniref:endolysin n=1 Tax=Gordonia phage GMA4 TaxID=1647471 RepID=UPI0006BC12FB|nr:endolysin [Gordonia phage GMA4]AKJ72296.1 putative lysin [Gordonia phage GMA4]